MASSSRSKMRPVLAALAVLVTANRFRTTRYTNDQSNQPSLDHNKSAEPTELDTRERDERICEPYGPAAGLLSLCTEERGDLRPRSGTGVARATPGPRRRRARRPRVRRRGGDWQDDVVGARRGARARPLVRGAVLPSRAVRDPSLLRRHRRPAQRRRRG